MRFTPVERVDRTGRTNVLRHAEESDAEALLNHLETTARETPFLIREPHELHLTPSQEAAFIKDKMNAERELLLVAVWNETLIGSCALMPIGPYQRLSHRCSVAIALNQSFCGAGVGACMMQALLHVAKDCGYEQAELEVISDNAPAIALYRKLGFVAYGRLPNNMKYADGRYVHADWMMKPL